MPKTLRFLFNTSNLGTPMLKTPQINKTNAIVILDSKLLYLKYIRLWRVFSLFLIWPM